MFKIESARNAKICLRPSKTGKEKRSSETLLLCRPSRITHSTHNSGTRDIFLCSGKNVECLRVIFRALKVKWISWLFDLIRARWNWMLETWMESWTNFDGFVDVLKVSGGYMCEYFKQIWWRHVKFGVWLPSGIVEPTFKDRASWKEFFLVYIALKRNR